MAMAAMVLFIIWPQWLHVLFRTVISRIIWIIRIKIRAIMKIMEILVQNASVLAKYFTIDSKSSVTLIDHSVMISTY